MAGLERVSRVVVLFVVRLSRKLGWSSLGTSLFQFQGFFQRVFEPEDIQLGMGDRASAAVLGSLLGQILFLRFSLRETTFPHP